MVASRPICRGRNGTRDGRDGRIGLLLNYFFNLIAAFSFRWAISFKDPACRALGIALAIYLALGIPFAIVFNPTANLYYWGALGLVLAMRRLEQCAGRETVRVLAVSREKLSAQLLAGAAVIVCLEG